MRFSEEEVLNYLGNLDVSKSSGPDDIPARLLKECRKQIIPSLCTLFNLSLSTGCVPAEWKCVNVTPIHKKDSKEPAMNYRPISLLPIISKVLERCVFEKFYDQVAHLISPAQHGFLCNRSCVTQLLSVFHNIGHNLDRNLQTDILYLDFSKAFDSVDHSILLTKLCGYGLTGSVLCWFGDYLHGRTQRVVVDGATCSWSPVTPGVPQGSILGPLLFIIFINDLPEFIENDTEPSLYADDTKLHQTITSINDCLSLQQSFSNLDNWSKQNHLPFNSSKCKVLTVTRTKTPIVHQYSLGDQMLTRVLSEKDLGVVTSTTLSWELHIRSIIAKANRVLGVLRRTCTSLPDVKIRRSLYLSLVKSQLSYATEVWSPGNNIMLSRRVEGVQRRANKWILMSGELDYKQRLKALNILPLTFDREIKDLVYLYKALFGFLDVDVCHLVSFITHGRTRLSRASQYTLQRQTCRTTTFQSSFYNRIVKIWNFICKDTNLDLIPNPNSFKTLLRHKYSTLLDSYDVDRSCMWSLACDCPCHEQ